MKHLIIITLILSYIISSAFLDSESSARITLADLLLSAIIFIAFFSSFRSGITISRVHVAILPMCLVFLVGAFFARNPERATLELVILLFGVIGSISIVKILIDLPGEWLDRFVRSYVLLMGGLSLICLIDFLALPGLISSRALGGLQGPFRNTGQAGSFFSVHFAIIFSLLMANLVPRRIIYTAATTLVFLALVFTLKRASIASFAVGILLFFLFLFFSSSIRDKKIASIFLGVGSAALMLGYVLFEWALEVVPGLRWRLEYKFSANSVQNFSEGFLAENIRSTYAALADSPLFGVGLDNVRDVYQSHEIHSTYLGVLAYGGVLGTIFYVFFMWSIIKSIYNEGRFKLHNPWSSFLYMILPLFIGQLIGWGYTYHLRKREFWILIIFIVVALKISHQLRRNQLARARSYFPGSRYEYGHPTAR
jgi:hypothetical protein